MAEEIRCWLKEAYVRDDRVDALQGLIRQMFNRRHHAYIASSERQWLTVELVQSLREQSEVYRTMSSTTEGPLPFALGYFRIRDDRLELVSDALPGGTQPKVLARLLSEFLEPGAQLIFQRNERPFGWRLTAEGNIEGLSEAALPDEAFPASS